MADLKSSPTNLEDNKSNSKSTMARKTMTRQETFNILKKTLTDLRLSENSEPLLRGSVDLER